MRALTSKNQMVIGLLIIPLLAGSCVRETPKECGSVEVAVKDKNYENAKDYETLSPVMAEDLPFASYINSLVMWNHIPNTNDYKVSDAPMRAGVLTYVLDKSYFVRGINGMTAIGNEEVASQGYSAEKQSLELHPNGREYTDIYVGTEDITFPAFEKHTIWLNRAQGKLLVEMIGMPAGVVKVDITVGNVYGMVDGDLIYAGEATVAKTFTPAAGSPSVLSMLLAPSIPPANTSPVNITITYANGFTDTIAQTPVSMIRNRITVIKSIYDSLKESWTIMVRVDDRWVKVNNLQID